MTVDSEGPFASGGSVRVGIAQRSENLAFLSFHALRILNAGFVVIALKMQHTMHDQMGEVRIARFVLFSSFMQHYRQADDEVADNGWFASVGK